MTNLNGGEDDFTRATATGLLRSLREIMDINQGMPVAQLYILLLVAQNEGKSLGELAKMAGVRSTTVSRYLLDFSEKFRDGAEGFKLIKRETDPEELRKNMYSLSPKGRHLIKSMYSHFEPKPKKEL